MLSISRVVTLLTPIFAGFSGWLAQIIADEFPGAPQLNESELTAVFIAGFIGAVAMAREWLVGRRQHEQNEAILDSAPTD